MQGLVFFHRYSFFQDRCKTKAMTSTTQFLDHTNIHMLFKPFVSLFKVKEKLGMVVPRRLVGSEN